MGPLKILLHMFVTDYSSQMPFGIFFYLQGLHVTFPQEPGTKEKTSISVSCNILQLTTMANGNVKLDHLLFSLSTSVVDVIPVTNRFPE
jgi:hypothetical protein